MKLKLNNTLYMRGPVTDDARDEVSSLFGTTSVMAWYQLPGALEDVLFDEMFERVHP